MEEVNVSSVNAEPVGIVDPQPINVEEPVNAGSTEVATEPTEVKQTPEQNSEFAKVRRETESKFRERQDKFAKQYGYETFEEMEQAETQRQIEQQNEEFAEKHGVSKDAIKEVYEELKRNDPDFQELSTSRAERNLNTALSDLNTELKDAGLDLQLKNTSVEELSKLPNVNKITELVNQRGLTLSEAFFIANKKDIIGKQTAKTEQETIKKLSANAQSSPGALGGGSEVDQSSIYSLGKTDFKSMVDQVLRGERKKL